jgi:hypothetical protein
MGDLGAEQRAMNLRQNRHGDRIRKLEKTVNGSVNEADSEENSKVHRMQELQMARELSEMKKEINEEHKQKSDEEVWWKRQRWVWGGALLLALFGTFSSACTGLIIWKVTAPPTLSRP